MEIVSRNISDLVFDPNNARKHDGPNLSAIKGSLTKFGQQKPIVIDDKNLIIAGNGTVAAARALGLEKIDCVITTLDKFNKSAFALADNRTSELADWDTDILSSTLKALKDIEFDISAIGFDDDFIITPPMEGLTDPDAVPENVETRCKPGDLWVLGSHRLLCGDSRNVQHVERLMGGEKADMVFTDPPYGMAYQSNAWDSTKSEVKTKRTDKAIAGDETTDVGKDSLRLLPAILKKEAHLYVWCRWDCFHDFLKVCEQIAKVKGVVVWDKGGPGLGDLECSYGDNEWAIHALIGRRPLVERQNSVWQVNRMKGLNMVHSTQKPIELCERAITNSTTSGDIVIDLFLGSGSTLIACEKTNRKCFGLEISPEYCDVILKRWELFTGKTAILVSGV